VRHPVSIESLQNRKVSRIGVRVSDIERQIDSSGYSLALGLGAFPRRESENLL
jgi:hypothetical protein